MVARYFDTGDRDLSGRTRADDNTVKIINDNHTFSVAAAGAILSADFSLERSDATGSAVVFTGNRDTPVVRVTSLFN